MGVTPSRDRAAAILPVRATDLCHRDVTQYCFILLLLYFAVRSGQFRANVPPQGVCRTVSRHAVTRKSMDRETVRSCRRPESGFLIRILDAPR